jgi:hypothetical protein
MAPSLLSAVVPQTEAIDGFITAQQVRDIRAQLRRMSEQRVPPGDSSGVTEDGGRYRHQRIGMEPRGVAGTLVVSDDLDEKVNSRLFN